MYEFLSQFNAKDNWYKLEKHLNNKDLLELALSKGYVEYWEAPKGSTYNRTLMCTLKGRLYMRKYRK